MAQVDHFEFIQKLLRSIEELRLQDVPLNGIALYYKEGHEAAIDDALNVLRREL